MKNFFNKQNFSNNLTDVEIPSKDYDNISSTVFSSSMSDSKITLCSQKFRNHDEDVDYTQTLLYKAFTPLIVSLKLVGMHHTDRKNDSGKHCVVPTVSQIFMVSYHYCMGDGCTSCGDTTIIPKPPSRYAQRFNISDMDDSMCSEC